MTFVNAINGLGGGQEYPYFSKGIALILVIVFYLLVLGFSIVAARLQVEELAKKHRKLCTIFEVLLVCTILVASFCVRVWYVKEYTMEPTSDYKTYYEIAQLLNQNTLIEEGPGYCDYIAMFPHVLGYSYVLSIVMKYFGDSVVVGQWFNIVLAVLTCFFVWRIIRYLADRVCALIGLCFIAFWPSQILYNNFLASEYLFSFLLCFSIWLFLYLVISYDPDHSNHEKYFILNIMLGILIGITSAIRPMGLLLLVSIAFCLIPCRTVLPIKPKNDLSLCARFLEKGWTRVVFILISYMITNAFLSKCVSYSIDQPIASGSASFGYNLLVGLNQESYGGWNQEDADYLYGALDETGSASGAQEACRDLAIQRFKVNPVSLLNLFLHKYEVLWANDDYAGTFNLLFMEQQGNLTEKVKEFYYDSREYGNYWYLVGVAFSVIATLYMRKREGSWCCVLLTLYLGTVALHLFVENQNRYHYHAIFLVAILSAQGVHYLYMDAKERIVLNQKKTIFEKLYEQEQEEALQRIEDAQEYAKEQMAVSMANSFDMQQALKEGHIVMSVTKKVEELPQELEARMLQRVWLKADEPQKIEEPYEFVGKQEEVPCENQVSMPIQNETNSVDSIEKVKEKQRAKKTYRMESAPKKQMTQNLASKIERKEKQLHQKPVTQHKSTNRKKQSKSVMQKIFEAKHFSEKQRKKQVEIRSKNHKGVSTQRQKRSEHHSTNREKKSQG